MKAHKYANLFPMMNDDEIETLAADIKVNGLLEPIWTHNGEILDGRNRFKACKIAHVKPDIKAYVGDDPLGFVVTLNLMRRHMTPAQRAMLGVALKAQYAEQFPQGAHHKEKVSGEEPRQNRDRAAAAVGVNPVYVDMAEQIKEKAPEIVNDVLRGDLPIKQAREIAKVQAPTARERIVRQVKTDKSNYEQTKRIIAEETKASQPVDTTPREVRLSWIKDKDVTEAESGWDRLFEQAERMMSSGEEPFVARSILDRWVLKAENFVDAFKGAPNE